MGIPDDLPPAEAYTTSIRGCARCHGVGHEDLLFKPMDNPFVGYTTDGHKMAITHWSMCPVLDQPIWLGRLEQKPSNVIRGDTIKEIVDWLKERENDMNAAPRDWLLIAKEIEKAFG